MTEESPNTAFVYLYRDAHNYKKWGEVVFPGRCSSEYEERIRAACISRQWFVARKIRVPSVFLYNEPEYSFTDADHGWHEFAELQPTDEAPTDKYEREIGEFVEEFEEMKDGFNETRWIP